MALSALGVANVDVYRRLKVCVFSTGKELVPDVQADLADFQVRDADGPFLLTALAELGIDVDFGGILGDKIEEVAENIRHRRGLKRYDLIITSGAVSQGRFDIVPQCFKAVGGQAKLHHVAVRPGHPIFFGVFSPEEQQKGNGNDLCRSPIIFDKAHCDARAATACFGLPGNPVACVACFRFSIVPYLRMVQNQQPEAGQLVQASHEEHPVPKSHRAATGGNHAIGERSLTFRLAARSPSDPTRSVDIIPSQGSHKIRPLVKADCWVVIPANAENSQGNGLFLSLPLSPTPICR